MTIDEKNKYTEMQKHAYENEANYWTPDNRDPVVGFFDQHNSWQDYDVYLFKGLDTSDKVALDFGCGPGRNIVKFANKFKQIDGIDIAQNNIDKAKIWTESNNLPFVPNLYVNSGVTISPVPSDTYDVVFSTICMQHIAVHDIRISLLTDFYRVLKEGGSICIQMGYGERPNSVDYYDNCYDAAGTNSFLDTTVKDPNYLKNDLYTIGFKEFEFDIRPVGPGDQHENWIFFRAKK